MKKIIILLLVIPPLLLAAIFGYVLYNGPRMTVQHHFREFQKEMPPRVVGTVTVRRPDPSAAESAALKNPLPSSIVNLNRGKVYYQYYCVFCHGDTGAGNGPVGQSYIPVPADLRTEKITRYGDGDLLRSMLTGVGHEPVLERVVPQEHRWYLVLFVRSLPQAR
ncbi:MAG: cytochrome C [Geobacteraceae bacterium GWC2_58_44]|nr:MAG: cytochrome C [Geobacteraceae bacterium GWC2_58_44]HBG05670.1 cytochrome C [Geobacter sp.]